MQMKISVSSTTPFCELTDATLLFQIYLLHF